MKKLIEEIRLKIDDRETPTDEYLKAIYDAIDLAVTCADGLEKELVSLRERRERFWQDACEWRGVDPECACKDCYGSGVKTYSSTATWRGGIGGQAVTSAVCDKCWGSGNSNKPWANLRKMQATFCKEEN